MRANIIQMIKNNMCSKYFSMGGIVVGFYWALKLWVIRDPCMYSTQACFVEQTVKTSNELSRLLPVIVRKERHYLSRKLTNMGVMGKQYSWDPTKLVRKHKQTHFNEICRESFGPVSSQANNNWKELLVIC